MDTSKLPDFSGKTVSFEIRSGNHAQTLYSPMFEVQGNRLFVVGIVPSGGTTCDWAEGAMGAVAWDDVTDYLVFDTKQYQKRIKEYDDGEDF